MLSVIGTSKITTRGQITIPVELRKLPGFGPGDRVAFVTEGKSLMLLTSDSETLSKLDESIRTSSVRIVD